MMYVILGVTGQIVVCTHKGDWTGEVILVQIYSSQYRLVHRNSF